MNLNRSASPALRFSTPLYDFVRFGTLLNAAEPAPTRAPFSVRLHDTWLRPKTPRLYQRHRRRITLAFTPPKPKPFDIACSMAIGLAASATRSTPFAAASQFS